MKTCREGITYLRVVEKVVEKVIRIFPLRYDFIVVEIKESKDLEIMKIKELQSSIEARELMVFDIGI